MVTLICGAIAFPLAYYMARYTSTHSKAIFYIAVMLPLWSNYLVRVYAWKLILAKEGVITWLFDHGRSRQACSTASWSLPVIGGPSLSVRYIGTCITFVLHLAALHGAAGGGGARARAALLHRGLGRSRRHRRETFRRDHPAAGDPRRRRRLDLHLLADARRLHHPTARRQLAAPSSAWRSIS